MAQVERNWRFAGGHYRRHPVYILQPIDWLLLALGIILFFMILWYVLSPPKRVVRKKKASGNVTIVAQQQQQYGTMARDRSPPARKASVIEVVVEETGVDKSYHKAVVNRYEDELDHVERVNSDLEEALYRQKEYTVDAYYEGAADGAAVQAEKDQDFAEIAFIAGVEKGAKKAELEVEKAYDAGFRAQVQNGVATLQQQLAQNLALEKESLALEKRKLEVAEANALALKRQEESDSMRLSLMDHERRLAALEAQRNNCNDITALHLQIEAQKRMFQSCQCSYMTSLQEQRMIEDRQLQANSLFLADQQRAAAALIAEQKRKEDEQAAHLMALQSQRNKEEEAHKQQMELERIIVIREQNEQIEREKNETLAQLEGYARELEAREATISAKESNAKAMMDASVEQQIRMEEDLRRKREEIAIEHRLLEEKRVEEEIMTHRLREAVNADAEKTRSQIEAELLAKKIAHEEEIRMQRDISEKQRIQIETELHAKKIATEEELRIQRDISEAKRKVDEAELLRKREEFEEDLELRRAQEAARLAEMQREALSQNYAVTADLSEKLNNMQIPDADGYSAKVTVTTKTVTNTKDDHSVLARDYTKDARDYTTEVRDYTTDSRDFTKAARDYTSSPNNYFLGTGVSSPRTSPVPATNPYASDYSVYKTSNYETYNKSSY